MAAGPMASAFTHAYFAFALRALYPGDPHGRRLAVLGMACAVLPDADVLWHEPFAHDCLHGHRGFTHSLVFAVVVGIAVASLAFRDAPLWSKLHVGRLRYLTFATLSHGVLDMLTNGGAGVAFLWPFSRQRNFLPWRPIEVSPLSVRAFFTERGLEVLASELRWVWLPTTLVCGAILGLRRLRRRRPPAVS